MSGHQARCGCRVVRGHRDRGDDKELHGIRLLLGALDLILRLRAEHWSFELGVVYGAGTQTRVRVVDGY